MALRVDIIWNAGQLRELVVRSNRAARYRISYGDKTVNLETRVGMPIMLDRNLHRIGH